MSFAKQPVGDQALSDNDFLWERRGFKRNKVWLAVDAGGAPIKKNNKVLIKYQLNQDHQYWVHPANVYPLTENSPAMKSTGKTTSSSSKTSGAVPLARTVSPDEKIDEDQIICVYTDGACSGNPGPAGIGVVMRYMGHEKEISRYIGQATNNIAELTAIRTALENIKDRDRTVLIYTDSSYSLGILSKGWKARQNLELVADIRELMTQFKDLRLIKVKGHAGHPDNERADRLAVKALETR
jgi:ribonuclease HI